MDQPMESQGRQLPLAASSHKTGTMITVKSSVETMFFITIATAIGLFVMVQVNGNRNIPAFSAPLPAEITPLPTTVPSGPREEMMDSPEGSKTLTMVTEEANEAATYALYISPKDEPKGDSFFKKTIGVGETVEIPFNTWAPDNAYIFLKEKKGSEASYIVFKSSGALFTNESALLSISELFAERVPNFLIQDITGWAAPNLLLINAEGKESDVKVSFWFDVPSQTFIQLGTYFK